MDIQEELARYTRAEMDYCDFSGVIRIIQNGSVIFETSRGYANIGFGIKNNIKTRFNIASVAKQFTAFAIMALYDKGLLELDYKETCK